MFRYPAKPRPGDKVAVALARGGGVGDVPGAARARACAGSRRSTASRSSSTPPPAVISPPAARAADVNAAFADPEITAIVASIGGNDQIKILRHLDAEVIAANPKPFFGVSDNTNLHNYLWNLGIVSYYGGAVMVELGRAGSINPHTAEAFRAALFGDGWYDLRPAETFTDINRDWADPANLELEPEMLPGTGWAVARRLAAGRGPALGRLPRDRRLQPPGRALPRAGRRGVRRVRAVPRDDRGAADRAVRRRGADVPGRARACSSASARCSWAGPKAWSFEHPNGPAERQAYVDAQHEAVLGAMAEYSPDVPVVLDVDFGHTDPQLVMPNGGEVRIDPAAGTISVRY